MSTESEPNGSITQANTIGLGSAVLGSLSAASDLDVYKFTVSAAGALSLVLDVPTSSSFSDYFALGLYDASGSRLNLYTTGVDKTYQTAAPAAGTYYLAVSSSTYYSGGSYSLTATHTAGSTAGFESEANGTFATANTLGLGTAIRGQLSGFSDIDTFKFDTSDAGVVTLAFDAPTDSSYSDYFTVRLTNASGSTISKITTGRDQTLKVAVAQAGTYFVEVSSGDYYYNGGTYLLTASFAAGGSGFELEPNDDSANALSSGAQIRGQLSSVKDTDWFYLKTSSASDLLLAFDAPTNSSFSNYFQVWVFDDDGNLLASKATGQDTTFSVGAAEPGNYFVAVTTSQSSLYDPGQYGLTVTAQASTVQRESETNDTTATADPLALGTNIRGQLSTAADVDRFAVTMTSAGTLTVNFDGPTNSTWTNY